MATTCLLDTNELSLSTGYGHVSGRALSVFAAMISERARQSKSNTAHQAQDSIATRLRRSVQALAQLPENKAGNILIKTYRKLSIIIPYNLEVDQPGSQELRDFVFAYIDLIFQRSDHTYRILGTAGGLAASLTIKLG
jgi:hypothetical protein